MASSSQRLALIKPDLSTFVAEDAYGVFQMAATMYSYFNSVGVNTAGYPTMDTANCPPLADNKCSYQLFDKPYALFVYERATLNGQNFAVRNPYYSKWTTLGGIARFGPANSAETSVTSPAGSNATYQTYASGAIYNITSGTPTGRLLAVQEPVWDLYVSLGGPTGTLGLPANEPLLLPNGRKRQTFESGAVDFDEATGAVLRLPVAYVNVQSPSLPLRMNLGDTVTLQASTFAAGGIQLTDRDIT